MKKKTSKSKRSYLDESYALIYKDAPYWGKEAIAQFMKDLRKNLNKPIAQIDPVERKSSKARDDEYGAS